MFLDIWGMSTETAATVALILAIVAVAFAIFRH